MPLRSRGQAAVELGGAFYVIGGYRVERDQATDVAPEEQNTPAYSAVFRYDPVDQRWTPRAHLPVGLYGLSAHVLDGKIYVFGGYGASGFEPVVQIYDPTSDSWSEGPRMPTPRYVFSSAVVDGRVFVIGGQGPASDQVNWEYKTVVEIFDPGQGWSTGSSLPRAVAGAASCAIDGRIYVFGGETDNLTSIYDVAGDSWSQGKQPGLARSGHSCVRVADALIVLGGHTKNALTLDLVEQYHPGSDSWTEREALPTPRYDFGADALGSKLYLFGGQTPSDLLDSVEVLDVRP
jgi:N-acetylneuraminic acid mutarotase